MDAPRGEDPARAVGTSSDRFHTRARQVSDGTALALLEAADPPLAYWSSPTGRVLCGAGSVRDLVRTNEEGLGDLETQATRLFDRVEHEGPEKARPRVLGGRAFEERRNPATYWEGFPPAWFFLPRTLITETPEGTWATETTARHASTTDVTPESIPEDGPPPSPPVDPHPLLTQREAVPRRETWMDQIEALRSRIDGGEFTKVVLAQTLSIQLDRSVSPVELVRRLRATNPNCYITALQRREGAIFVSATPERLVRRRGSRIDTEALAGSIPRGESIRDDDRLSTTLRESRKDSHEHDLVVESITDGLRRLGATVETGDRSVRQLRAVQHLHTPVRAEHPDAPHVLSFVDELHPTPAVGGLPRACALSAIRSTESFDRGWYAGPIGWFDAAGDGDFAIGIRSGVFHGRNARLFAGAGIVADSEPAAEWDELMLKYRPVLDALTER